MEATIRYVGPDVHKDSIAIGLEEGSGAEPQVLARIPRLFADRRGFGVRLVRGTVDSVSKRDPAAVLDRAHAAFQAWRLTRPRDPTPALDAVLRVAHRILAPLRDRSPSTSDLLRDKILSTARSTDEDRSPCARSSLRHHEAGSWG